MRWTWVSLCLCLIPICYSAEFDDFMERQKALYLCQWRQSHLPDDNPHPLDICQNSNQSIDEMRPQLKLWWEHWFAKQRDAFEDDWTNGSAIETARAGWGRMQRDRQAAMEAESAAHEADDEKVFAAKARHMTNTELCLTYYGNEEKEARRELSRRHALTQSEWSLIDHKQIQIGMSEVAMLCSWGSTEVNRTVTAAIEYKQYVYPGSTYVYVENGKVVSFQDSRK